MPKTKILLLIFPSLFFATCRTTSKKSPEVKAPEIVDNPLPEVVDNPLPIVETGRWTTGDLHVHTIQSNDAQKPLEDILSVTFEKNKLDWLATTNHLRLSDRNSTGATIAGGSIPMSRGIGLYEAPAIKAFEESKRFPGKTIYSTVEWDMPTHEHFIVGITGDSASKSYEQFEYLFTDRDLKYFDPNDIKSWGNSRWNKTHEDARTAVQWLNTNHPIDSYGIFSHPSRLGARYKISDFREFHDLAPHIIVGIEGMVGNQMEPDRGSYATDRIEENSKYRTYGGTDAIVAKLGGTWDALLGEGRRIWNFANSDFHFKTAQDKFSSGYYPGEYSKNYIWVDGEGVGAIVKGIKSGRAFSVFGDLISALDFQAQDKSRASSSVPMGSELKVAKDSQVVVTIRFKSDVPSAYEHPVGSGLIPGRIPEVDHIDLIAGDVTPKALPGTASYDLPTNPSTRVLARFTAKDWTTDSKGYQVILYEYTASKDQYLRLRGTNLGLNVPLETENGEPLADAKTDLTENQARFDAINDRNYADLWFYSNPIFVKISSDQGH